MGSGGSEKFQYFYHPDHLEDGALIKCPVGIFSDGPACRGGYITDTSGEVYQHLEYFAFGGTFVEEHSNTDRVPYLFNGKELDEETGLYYYGARYYEPKVSVWLSVDPLSDRLPAWSPYVYSFNSPASYVDPDGKIPLPLITGIVGGVGGFIYGAFKYGFKNGGWKKTLAATAGGFVGGATLGFGGAALVGAGGAAAIGGANTAYIIGGSSIAGAITGSLTEQGVGMALGAQNGFNENDFVLSMTLAIPEALLGEAISKPIGNALKSEISDVLTQELKMTVREENAFIKETTKKIKEASQGALTRKQSKMAATKTLNLAKETNQSVLNVSIQATEEGINVGTVVVDKVIMEGVNKTAEDN